MRPICTVVDGLPSERTTSLFPGPVSVSEMSLLRALDPVQNWLGQELEKCGIDAMIYTRYILSLLLHDSYDYDLQEQENDIFLGWEKGPCKKWGKGKKKSSDLTLEEMKKQAAVQCLLSASDESSGIETLVEELCSKLRDLQSNQEEKSNKKLDGTLSPETTLSPAGKDQAEMYYEAFPPLSEKPVCLQEIMTVWNKSKVCSYSSSSSSSTAPQTSTETPSPKDCNSESETIITSRNSGASNTVQGKNQQRGKNEKENKFNNGASEDKTSLSKNVRHKPNGKSRPRSWSSGSSEAGSSSSGNKGDLKKRFIRVRHKIREVRNKKGKSGQRLQTKNEGRQDGKYVAGSSSGSVTSVKPLYKLVKRPVKELECEEVKNEKKSEDIVTEKRNEMSKKTREFEEEPLWYTRPMAEYFFPPNSKSKLETTYRKRQDNWNFTSKDIEELSESVRGLNIGSHNIHSTYLAAGTFIEGHFVEMPAAVSEMSDHTGTSNCSLAEDDNLDDVHPKELPHFYEVEIDQSMLDSCASDMIQGESRILNMIRQKSTMKSDFEAESCKVLDERLQMGSAIWAKSKHDGADVFMQDSEKLWNSFSTSSSVDADGESLGGDSPNAFCPFSQCTQLNTYMHAGNQDSQLDSNSCFSVFEVQCSNSVFPLPTQMMLNEMGETDSCSSMNGLVESPSILRTKHSAFEIEQCSNRSTRTCSSLSYSEETRSDTETSINQLEDGFHLNAEDLNCVVSRVTLSYLDDSSCIKSVGSFQQNEALRNDSLLVSKKKSKLESVCGIQLEQENVEICDTTEVGSSRSQNEHGYSSGFINDIWAHLADLNCERVEEMLFPVDVNNYSSMNAADGTFQEPNKAVQRSEYHLWDSQKDVLEKSAFLRCESSKVDVGDYTTPSRPWDINHVKENSFILGGVYGELKPFNCECEWAMFPPNHTKESLLECASSDVVTIAGTDVFMTPGNSFAPGHRQLCRPFVSFDESEPSKSGDKVSNKGFSIFIHENLLGACGNFQLEEPGMGYSFSSFELNNQFSQVLHVECSFEPEGIVATSPNFKPKSLCSESDGELGHPRVCGVDKTQYRSIRISPRTHFRPISASELSPGGGSESEFESEKDDLVVPIVSEGEVFDDPQDDLKPLEEDAENEGHFYGKSELESGKFLPRLQKSGMEKSAQTSLDCQEESIGTLALDKQDHLDFRVIESFERGVMENSKTNCKMLEQSKKEDGLSGYKMGCNPMPPAPEEKGEYPSLSVNIQGVNAIKEKQCWWQKALYSPLIPGSSCDSQTACYTQGESPIGHSSVKEIHSAGFPIEINTASTCKDPKVAVGYRACTKSSGFRKKIYSSDSSSSDTASDGGPEWADICRGELFSRTQL